MITLTYPSLDWEAAGICIRIQALLASHNHKIFVVPRHLGHDKKIVCQRLSKTKTLFIIATKKKFDKALLKEIEFYYKNRKKANIVQFSPVVPFWNRPTGLNTRIYKVGKKSYTYLTTLLKERHSLMYCDDEESRLVETLIITMLMIKRFNKSPENQ
ncbi:MAG: hypothetical protein IPK91_02750 [Saprospiraceae bacterium]|nr:hypothetical protein [Saprospiraceae bacterium]MBK8296209.1 hypothetical protein [Saprospiraceae bacterium]